MLISLSFNILLEDNALQLQVVHFNYNNYYYNYYISYFHFWAVDVRYNVDCWKPFY